MVNINESPDPRSNLWAAIAFYLRFYRQQHAQTGDCVASLLNRSRSSISRLESGESQLRDEEAAILDQEWRTGGLFSVLLWYARLGHDPNWAKSYLDFEERASEIRMYDGQLIPVLLQTPAYCRALLLAGRTRSLDKDVDDRVSRQKILRRSDPPELWVLLAETALSPEVGGPEVMRAQLAHLLELAHLPNVFLRVVPNSAGANEGLDGPFKVITVHQGTVGFIHAQVGGRLVLDALTVTGLRSRFDRIGADALSRTATRAKIKQLMEAMR